MRHRLHLAISLTITASLLVCACQTRPDDYQVPGGGGQLYRIDDAQRVMIEHALAVQIKPALDAPLKAVHIELPSYPDAWKAVRGHREEWVTIRFHVTEAGAVSEPVVVAQSDPSIASSCLALIARWRFEPPMRRGQAVSVPLAYRFMFKLD